MPAGFIQFLGGDETMMHKSSDDCPGKKQKIYCEQLTALVVQARMAEAPKFTGTALLRQINWRIQLDSGHAFEKKKMNTERSC